MQIYCHSESLRLVRAAALSIVLAVSGLAAFSAAASERAKVKIDTGTLVGIHDEAVRIFKGIPFAAPPVGELRWMPPVRPAAWMGERDATKFSLPCPQPVNADGTANGGGVSGMYDEDCLYLNVWAPANAENAPRNLPVMLWLYGGAGFLGAGHLGSYNGAAFARNGVIVVTINYRLGALGYFAHPALTKAAKADEPLANYALMDAIAGLQWVQRNITAFGGDPNNVTLFGQSAGGVMVINLLSVPSAKGLFHKAIVQSGAFLQPGSKLAEAEQAGAQAMTALGLPGAQTTLQQLRSIPAKTLVETEATRRGFGSAVDGRFRTASTVDALKAGTAIDVPLIIGSNNGEAGADNARTVAVLAASGAPSYLYQFQYVPQWRKAQQPKGAPHSAELVYVFDSWATSAYGGPSVTPKDRQVSRRVNSCWVAFAKTTKPPTSLICADGFQWPRYSQQNDAIVLFGEMPQVGKAASIPKFEPPPRTSG